MRAHCIFCHSFQIFTVWEEKYTDSLNEFSFVWDSFSLATIRILCLSLLLSVLTITCLGACRFVLILFGDFIVFIVQSEVNFFYYLL